MEKESSKTRLIALDGIGRFANVLVFLSHIVASYGGNVFSFNFFIKLFKLIIGKFFSTAVA